MSRRSATALQAARDGRARVCVATDVAARGIDLPDLGLVVHADHRPTARPCSTAAAAPAAPGARRCACSWCPTPAAAAPSSCSMPPTSRRSGRPPAAEEIGPRTRAPPARDHARRGAAGGGAGGSARAAGRAQRRGRGGGTPARAQRRPAEARGAVRRRCRYRCRRGRTAEPAPAAATAMGSGSA
ncbi:MAG: helicase-related protein [Geminicoccaceae bacterium]